MKVILDTNIIIDAIAARIPFNVEAEKIILLAAEQKILAAITASTASDIYYLGKKYLKDEKLIISKLKIMFTLLDIVAVDKSDCIAAFDTGIKDYEDSLLTVCSEKWDAEYIITRDIKDFINSAVPAILPKDFLNLV